MSSIAVVIPCYNVRDHILSTINAIGAEVELIVVVDDKCPQNTGTFVETHGTDPRVRVIYNEVNKGVGGAVIAGYRHAVMEGADILVKIDGDGQMDPQLIPYFAGPIRKEIADYTKGNRFFAGKALRSMPAIRLLGNAVLSFMTKASSGYWNILDPTNGYTAISAKVAKVLDLDEVSNRYFFESDMLFQLGKLRAKVIDVPIMSLYGDEVSNLKIAKVMPEFFGKNIKNLFKRILYSYFIRGFSLASIALLGGILLLLVGLFSAVTVGLTSNLSGVAAATGTVVSIALMLIFGFQLLLTFLANDIASTPDTAIHPLLADMPRHPLPQSYPSVVGYPATEESD